MRRSKITMLAINLTLGLISNVIMAISGSFLTTNYRIINDKGPTPSTHLIFKSQTSHSFIHCVTLCASDVQCVVVYAYPMETKVTTATGPIANSRISTNWGCRFSDELIDTETLPSGNGSYAYPLGDMTVRSIAPTLGGGIFLKIHKTTDGNFAIYDCSENNSEMTRIGLLFDYAKGRWPDINNTKCANTICAQSGLAGTLLKVVGGQHTSSSFQFQPLCEADEQKFNDMTCDENGTWTFSNGSPHAGCVSTTCSRNSEGRGVYLGTHNVTMNGTQCQEWNKTRPNWHTQTYFPEEYGDKEAAKNYCRDPDNSGDPWCYAMIEKMRWDFCNITKCTVDL